MKTIFHIMSILIAFIGFLISMPINGENEDPMYEACSRLYSCGKIKNVGHPFWGNHRPDFCGIPEFKLSCFEDNDLRSVMDGHNQEFNVDDIDRSSKTIEFHQGLFDSCQEINIIRNFRLPLFKPYGYNYTDLNLFYECHNCSFKNNVTCSDARNNDTYC